MVRRWGFYGLITRNPDGTIAHFAYIAKTEPNTHEFFLEMGWYFVEGAGYYDKESNIADAYDDGEYVMYPSWKEN